MDDNIVGRQIAFDLNIQQFQSESEHEYGHRLLYSALAAWARVQVLGKSFMDASVQTADELDYHAVDILHIRNRLAQVAYGLLHVLSYDQEWVKNLSIDEASGRLAGSITEMLLFCRELSRLNNRLITVSPWRKADFNDNQLIMGGTEWKGKQLYSVGIGRWLPRKQAKVNYKEIAGIPACSLQEYYSSMLNDVAWEKGSLPEAFNIFKTGSNRWYAKAWIASSSSQALKIPQGISLMQRLGTDGGYFMVKREGSDIRIANLDKWYNEEKELYRMMYMLDSRNHSCAVFKVKRCSDHVILHCHSALPNAETRLLLLSSWPYRSFDDKYRRIIPVHLWPSVESWLIELGILTQEVNVI